MTCERIPRPAEGGTAGLASVIELENSLHLEDSLHLDAGSLQFIEVARGILGFKDENGQLSS